jgi:putative hemolysin
MKQVLLVVLVLGALAVVACGAQQQPTATPTPSTFESPLGLPNPASKFCEDQGYKLEMRTDANGGTAGFCIFPDGTECDEWAFYRGECGPATPTP